MTSTKQIIVYQGKCPLPVSTELTTGCWFIPSPAVSDADALFAGQRINKVYGVHSQNRNYPGHHTVVIYVDMQGRPTSHPDYIARIGAIGSPAALETKIRDALCLLQYEVTDIAEIRKRAARQAAMSGLRASALEVLQQRASEYRRTS